MMMVILMRKREEEEKEESHDAGGLARGRTRVSDCLSRNRWGGFSKKGKKGIRKAVVLVCVRVRLCVAFWICMLESLLSD